MDKLREKYISRIHSILIPYLLWCTVYFLFFAVLVSIPYTRNQIDPAALNITVSFYGWLRSLWPDEYYTLWFLKELLLYILFCPLIWYVLKNRYTGGIVIVVLMFIDLAGVYPIPLDGIHYYLSGAYLAIHLKGYEYYRTQCLHGLDACIFCPWQLPVSVNWISFLYACSSFSPYGSRWICFLPAEYLHGG